MREAFGGAFTIRLMLIFLAVYVAFIAVALNYAKAFRVKNKVIDIIEQNEGITDFNDTSDGSPIGKIDTYLGTVGYFVNLDPSKLSNNLGENKYCYNRGYCIELFSNANGEYYKVTTYIRIDLPFKLTGDGGISIPIMGETRKIERINA